MIWLAVALSLAAAAAAPAPLRIPPSLTAEHQDLHHRLETLVYDTGDVGRAARNVEAMLARHFHREEQIALPPLGLLASLSAGRITDDMKPAIAMADTLKAELPRMLEDHRKVKGALDALAASGRTAGRDDVAAYVEAMGRHIAFEEEILYPAAILAGERVRQGLAR